MKQYLIGIDVGTSGTKSALFDLDGNVIASATAEYPLYQPQNGWAEQDPEDWWRAVVSTLSDITERASDGEICGIGLSGQMHGLVVLEDNTVLFEVKEGPFAPITPDNIAAWTPAVEDKEAVERFVAELEVKFETK